jgi:hypothetical protein
MQYLSLREIKSRQIMMEQLPFVKRYPYKPETELRFLWQSKVEEKSSFSVPIPLHTISRIVLSPWLHPSLSDSVKKAIKSIADCQHIPVYHSTLVNNINWITHGKLAQ